MSDIINKSPQKSALPPSGMMSDEFYMENARTFLANCEKLDNSPLPFMIAACFKNEAQNKLLRAELERVKGELARYEKEYAWHENQRLCVGYSDSAETECCGDLEGTAHEAHCPAQAKDEILRPHLYKSDAAQPK